MPSKHENAIDAWEEMIFNFDVEFLVVNKENVNV